MDQDDVFCFYAFRITTVFFCPISLFSVVIMLNWTALISFAAKSFLKVTASSVAVAVVLKKKIAGKINQLSHLSKISHHEKLLDKTIKVVKIGN